MECNILICVICINFAFISVLAVFPVKAEMLNWAEMLVYFY